MIKRHFLEFEKPLEEISDKIDALEIVSKDNPELRSQVDKLQSEFEDRTKKIYQLGDPVPVKVEKTDILKRQLNFILDE